MCDHHFSFVHKRVVLFESDEDWLHDSLSDHEVDIPRNLVPLSKQDDGVLSMIFVCLCTLYRPE